MYVWGLVRGIALFKPMAHGGEALTEEAREKALHSLLDVNRRTATHVFESGPLTTGRAELEFNETLVTQARSFILMGDQLQAVRLLALVRQLQTAPKSSPARGDEPEAIAKRVVSLRETEQRRVERDFMRRALIALHGDRGQERRLWHNVVFESSKDLVQRI